MTISQSAGKIFKPKALIAAGMITLLAAAILAFCLLSSPSSTTNAARVTQARAYVYKAVQSPSQSNLEPIGVIDFTDIGQGQVALNGSLSGLSPGEHGFHVHQFGEIGQNCVGAGPHLNPHGKTHGAPDDQERHVGDLGNVQANSNGAVSVRMRDHIIALDGVNSILGRGLVVHEKADDLGRGGNAESKKTGNAGARVGCGVIGVRAEAASTSG